MGDENRKVSCCLLIGLFFPYVVLTALQHRLPLHPSLFQATFCHLNARAERRNFVPLLVFVP